MHREVRLISKIERCSSLIANVTLAPDPLWPVAVHLGSEDRGRFMFPPQKEFKGSTPMGSEEYGVGLQVNAFGLS